eukprot:Gb_36012 [translate_table: standard]
MALFLVRIALVISVLPLSNSIHQDRMAESAAISLQISLACQATQYPDLCKSSLMGSPVATKPAQPQDIIEAAFGLSADGVKHSHSLCQTILAASSGNFNLTIAAQNCLESLNASIRLISKSSSAPLLDKRIKDVKAWMSAALTRQYDARSAFRNVNTTEQVRSTVEQIDCVMCLTSNALSMADALDTYGNDIISWKPPQTERSNSSAKPTGSQKSFSTDMPTLRELIPNVIVSKDKSSVYSSIQAAVNSAPDDSLERFIIYIKAGIYEEIVTIPPTKTNIMFIGDGMDQTLITGSMSADQPGIGTYGSATVGVNADGFVARDIAFENAAGPESHQAVALRADCDLCAFQNCAFLGHQDTLYAHTLRQFYKDCRIEGTVDFIFGNSASVFHNCLILVRPRQLSSNNGETNTISAHGRTDPAQSTGFVLLRNTRGISLPSQTSTKRIWGVHGSSIRELCSCIHTWPKSFDPRAGCLGTAPLLSTLFSMGNTRTSALGLMFLPEYHGPLKFRPSFCPCIPSKALFREMNGSLQQKCKIDLIQIKFLFLNSS